MRAVNLFQTPVDKSGQQLRFVCSLSSKDRCERTFYILSFVCTYVEADHIRKEYEESNARLSKMQSRISSLTEKLKKDFGKLIRKRIPAFILLFIFSYGKVLLAYAKLKFIIIGPEKEFYSFYGRCLESKQNKFETYHFFFFFLSFSCLVAFFNLTYDNFNPCSSPPHPPPLPPI